MAMLAEPNQDLAARVLNETDFDNRLIGYRLHRRAGPAAVSLYSLEDLAGFLAEPIPQIDLARLEKWVRDVVQDPELANQISELAATDNSPLEKLLRIRLLIEQRLGQCKRLTS